MQTLCKIAGVVAVLGGAFLILMAYAFATMIDPELEGAARRSTIAHRMFTGKDSPLGFGIFLIVVGLWLAISKPKSPA